MSDDRKLAAGRLPEQIALMRVLRASEAISLYGDFASHFQRPHSASAGDQPENRIDSQRIVS